VQAQHGRDVIAQIVVPTAHFRHLDGPTLRVRNEGQSSRVEADGIVTMLQFQSDGLGLDLLVDKG
jgi:hypothetical protein